MPKPAVEGIRDEHLAIGQAILDHDEEEAAKLMTAHMEQIDGRTRGQSEFLRQRIEWR